MSAAKTTPAPVEVGPPPGLARRFCFERDSFAFANELHWAYHFDAASGRTTFTRREPKPDYALRCFVLTRTARQFLYHARFDPEAPATNEIAYRRMIREIVSRNPRMPCPPDRLVVFPGYEGLRKFSAAWEPLLKAECGGAWRSYVLRSHWRMVFPISRAHQARTAGQLATSLCQGGSPLIHLVRFPQLTINHGMILFEVNKTSESLCFEAYDPNDPTKPTQLSYSETQRTFSLPANAYWAGGRLDVIEIYRNWFL